ncbi:pre-rRNA 2'-O-ribose RNA methyltransferase FTSJ3 isoform X2 [Petaurus breviceps papuanus]|uniref:pre-rRNA 2'-O-ribose RNA methyltransferase FTSJ3 isoform X2 n=1 Tax=Petaurus breviceps papuanus TaxID=3040969 RepID=UPI0036DF4C5D
MGKKGKVGKSRRDKFYHLAKETGFRSRSAFKLIQLNRRFQFLQKARALLDLCAAPGGWLQVASKFMPVSSLIVGVDLVPIKPIPNVVTLQEDITTERCRQALRKELKTWKVDVVLNDGAPNVGASWVHDAYSQAHLTLMALRLACDFLARGGCFITKVFRSRDYQPLLWIFQQLFRHVQATKPQASRQESAEIFVVCQGFLAPDKIDSKFFDPKFAFKEVEVQAKTVSELVTKKKPKAEGYAEGDLTLYHRVSITDFLRAANPVDFLSKASEIVLDDKEMEQHPATSEDVKVHCQDIKVLGRKELRSLLNWRTKLRRFVAKKLKDQAKALDISLSSGEEEEEEQEEQERKKTAVAAEDDEEDLDRALAEMKAQEVAELKRKKKKLLREQRKQRERVELKMDLPGVSIADDGKTGMFSLRTIRGHQLLQEVAQGNMGAADKFLLEEPESDIYLSDEEDEDADDYSLASDLDPEELAGAKGYGAPPSRKRVKFAKQEHQEEEEEQENPLLVPLEEKAVVQEEQTNLWFSKGGFAGIEDDEDQALEISQAQLLYESQCQEKQKHQQKPASSRREKLPSQPQAQFPSTEEKPSLEAKAATSREEEDDSSSDSDSSSEDERKLIKRSRGKKQSHLVEPDDGFVVVPIEDPVKRQILDPEGLALGAMIASSQKTRRDLVDDSFSSLYKKAGFGKEKRQVTYVVAKKGVGQKVRRPAGVKGHFKVVDARLKKDLRAQQHKEQRYKGRRKK